MLGRSQVFYGYAGREVLSVIDGARIATARHIQMALTKVAELEEKRATALPQGEASALLNRPFSTFDRGYFAEDGFGSIMLMSCIHEAKELGATKEYIENLVYSINNFWETPMNEQRLKATVLSAI
jgi:hypothetical protein